MIPNALATTGPHAGFWSYLKSIDHALERAIELGDSAQLERLDRERLLSLAEFLEVGLRAKSTGAYVQPELSQFAEPQKPDYSSAIDLHHHLTTVEIFNAWLKSSKLGVEKKLQRLIEALRVAAATPEDKLFAKEFPLQELELARAVAQSLLTDAEAALL